MKGVKIIIVIMLSWFAIVQGPMVMGLREHNRLRKRHGVPPLEINDAMCSEAKAYAQILAAKGSLTASDPSGEYSENLCSRRHTPEKCVQYWYDENIYYDYSRPKFSFQTAHFTGMVWASSTQLGWGQARDSDGVYYVVARYAPPGNKEGEFAANVLKPRYGTNAAFGKTGVSINAMIISIFFGLLTLRN